MPHISVGVGGKLLTAARSSWSDFVSGSFLKRIQNLTGPYRNIYVCASRWSCRSTWRWEMADLSWFITVIDSECFKCIAKDIIRCIQTKFICDIMSSLSVSPLLSALFASLCINRVPLSDTNGQSSPLSWFVRKDLWHITWPSVGASDWRPGSGSALPLVRRVTWLRGHCTATVKIIGLNSTNLELRWRERCWSRVHESQCTPQVVAEWPIIKVAL